MVWAAEARSECTDNFRMKSPFGTPREDRECRDRSSPPGMGNRWYTSLCRRHPRMRGLGWTSAWASAAVGRHSRSPSCRTSQRNTADRYRSHLVGTGDKGRRDHRTVHFDIEESGWVAA